MTREDQIKIAMCENLSTKGNVVSGLTKTTAAISQLFDQEMIEFAEWMHSNTVYCVNGFYAAWVNPEVDRQMKLPELLQLFKEKQ